MKTPVSQHCPPALANLQASNATDVIPVPDNITYDPLYAEEVNQQQIEGNDQRQTQQPEETTEEEIHGFAQRMVCPSIAIFMVSILFAGCWMATHWASTSLPH